MSNKLKIQDLIDSKLIEERKVFLWGQVDDKSAKHVVDRLMYLDALETKDIHFYINSPGGYVTSGFAIYDCMKSLKSEVSTICTGFAASMGSILLSAGAKGKRFIQPHARVMIHQPSGGARGPASDIEITAQEILKTKELSARLLAENCGQTLEKVMKDFNRDHWMDAEESVAYGIVDKVAQ
ncbi:ClpP family protease [Gelidibacter sp. F63206]|uniref:ClpP family protease n=1 Tax=Gelidibacter sp. F63206 TaxID=2926425 RepID=UPI001FF4801E|nr:ATP-dependent Clp protease proteolytic subunit [Gelidibacter sp. F63206]MCK0115003.1 ATP-dependent Clp protease proteolytic subunit [Gelidibacter sp. F63206]